MGGEREVGGCHRQRHQFTDRAPDPKGTGSRHRSGHGLQRRWRSIGARDAGRSVGDVDMDALLAELLDVLLDLSQLRLVLLLPLDLPHRVQLREMGLSLVIGVHRLPLGLQAFDQVLALLVVHRLDGLLRLPLGLLQLVDVVVLRLDVLLHLREVLRDLAKVLLLEVVLGVVRDLLRRGEDRLHGVRHHVVLRRAEVHDGSLVAAGHRGLHLHGELGRLQLLRLRRLHLLEGLDLLLVGPHLHEVGGVVPDGAGGLAHDAGASVGDRLEVQVACHVAAVRGVGAGSVERRRRGGQLGVVLRPVHRRLLHQLRLRRDDVVDGLLHAAVHLADRVVRER
mmetsp:Transcript_4710/g.9659  ORF Transcript_4710/g.9659 Transcript_4710/m.9659 type:complete len:337 (-) Transcript_4710:51-1061(-)